MSRRKKWPMDVIYFLRIIDFYSLGLYMSSKAGHSSLYAENCFGVFGKGNPPCNAEDNLHAGYIVIEAWFRGY